MRFPVLLKVFPLLLVVLVAGCHRGDKKGDEVEYLPVEKMYEIGKTALDDHNYGKVIKYDERLIARFPFGAYTEQATLDLAYAQYKTGKPEDAYSTINRFIKTYPTHKHADYAYYLRGIINFDRDKGFLDRYANQDMTKRDQGNTLQSFEDFNDLVTRYPNSRYAADARQRMIYLRDNLARGDINVAEFYLRRGAYVAAINRAQAAIVGYPQTQANEAALDVLAKSYDKLGLTQLRDDSLAVLKRTFPESPYLAAAPPKPWWKFW